MRCSAPSWRRATPALATRFEEYRAGATVTAPQESALLIDVARPLGAFVARLFQRRAGAAGAARHGGARGGDLPDEALHRPAGLQALPRGQAADRRSGGAAGGGRASSARRSPSSSSTGDDELTLATVIDALLAQREGGRASQPEHRSARALGGGAPVRPRRGQAWSPAGCRSATRTRSTSKIWCRCGGPDAKLTNITEGPAEHRRRRDGFGLTDGRMSPPRGRVASPTTACTATSARRTPARRGCTTSRAG